MTAPQKPQQEPTMEEILASIRRIIADDNQPAVSDPGQPPGEDADILTLTQVVEEPPPMVPPEPEEAVAEAAFEEPITFEPPPLPEPPYVAPRPAAAPEPPAASFDDQLLSAAAAAATGAAFAGLAGGRPAEPAPAVSMGGGKTVEEIVRELLRPMLKDWLDANLPDLAERLVRTEIDRVSRRFRD